MVKKTGKKLILSAAFVLAMTLAGCGTAATSTSVAPASQSTAPTSQSTAPTSQSTHEHAYGAPVWDWADLDNGNVFAKFSCTCGDTQKKKATLDGSDKKDATCTEAGYVNWKAEVEFLSQKYQDTKKVDEAAKGHKMTPVAADPATCTKEGILAHYHCDQCQKNFQDEQGQTEMKSVVDPIKAHTLTEVQIKDATCYEDGVSVHHWHCSVCEQNFSDAEGKTKITGSVVAPKTNHQGTCDKTDAVAATCYVAGNIDYWHCTACGDYWNNADLDPTHKITQAQTVVAATNHKDTVSHVDRVEATCTEAGNIEYWHCTACGDYWKDADLAPANKITQAETVIAAKGHTGVHVDATIAFCAEPGTVEHYHCSECGKNFSDSACKTEIQTIIDPAKPAIGHHSYMSNGYSCDCCGADDLVKKGYIKDNFAKDTSVAAPAGFLDVYTSELNIGNNTAATGNTLFAYAGKYDGYYGFEMGVYIPSDANYMTNRPSCDSWVQYLVACRAAEGEWVIFHAERESLTATEWNITATYASDGATATWLNSSTQPVGEVVVAKTDGNAIFQVLCPYIYSAGSAQLTFTEVLGYKEAIGSHSYGELVAAKAATCGSIGYAISHYHCSTCGRYFDENKKPVNKADVIIPATGHVYEGASCTKCGITNLGKVSGILRADSAENTTVAKPAGFAEVYDTTYEVGGGEGETVSGGNSFVKWHASCADYTHLKIGLYCPGDKYMTNATKAGNALCKARNNTAEWIIFDVIRDNAASNKWVLTAKYASDGSAVTFVNASVQSIGTSVEITTSDHYINDVLKFYTWGGNSVLTHTEFAALSGCNVHAYGDLIAAKGKTCTEDGYTVDHYECSACHKFFDVNKVEIVDKSSIIIPAGHTYDAGGYSCTVCGYDNLAKKTGYLRDSSVAITSIEAPTDFIEVYETNYKTGGGAGDVGGNTLFKWVAKYTDGNYTEIKFGTYIKKGNWITINASGNHLLGNDTSGDAWYIITLTRPDTSSRTWTYSATLADGTEVEWRDAGTTKIGKTFTYECQEGDAKFVSFLNIYIFNETQFTIHTEILAK